MTVAISVSLMIFVLCCYLIVNWSFCSSHLLWKKKNEHKKEYEKKNIFFFPSYCCFFLSGADAHERILFIFFEQCSFHACIECSFYKKKIIRMKRHCQKVQGSVFILFFLFYFHFFYFWWIEEQIVCIFIYYRRVRQ